MKQGWEYKKLGEVCNITMGQSPDGKSINDNEGVEFHQGKTCFGERTLGVSCLFSNAPVKLAEANSVLLCVRAPVGYPNITNRKICIGRGLCALYAKENIDNTFLFYSLLGKQSHFEKNATGSTFKAISSKVISNTEIPFPPKSTQLSIVSELDKINELIRLKKEQLKDYDNLAQSIFYEMFGDPVDNEKGWEVKKWKEVFNTILGKMLDKSKQINHLKQYKYLANMNVQWGYFDLKELRSMTFTDEELAKYELRNNDLLICEGGDAGRCAIWKETDETILFQKAIHRARLIDTDNADVVYIRYWMQFYKVNKGLKDYISKSTIEHLTGDKLKRLPIPLPPLPLQHLFAQRIEQIERQKSAVQKSITDLETILASRMQYWFE